MQQEIKLLITHFFFLDYDFMYKMKKRKKIKLTHFLDF